MAVGIAGTRSGDVPNTKILTEDQIERSVQSKVDSADAAFLRGDLDQERYNARMKEIDRWAEQARR